MSPVQPSPSLVDWVISTFSFDPKPLTKPTESPSRGGRKATQVGLRNDLGICRVAGKGVVECHKRATPTPSRTTDPDSTRSHPLTTHRASLSSPSDRDRRRNSALLVCEEPDRVTHINSHRPLRRPDRARGLKKNAKDGDLELARSTTPTHPVPRRAPTPGSASIASSDL